MKIDRLAIVWTSSEGGSYAEPSRVLATMQLQTVAHWRTTADAALDTAREVSDRLELIQSSYALTVTPYRWDSKVESTVWAGYIAEIRADDIKFIRSVDGVASHLVVSNEVLDTLHNLEFDTLYERGNDLGYSYIRLGTTLFVVNGAQWDLSDHSEFEDFLRSFYNDTAFAPEATIGMENAEATPEEIENLVETYARRASEDTLTGVDTGANVDYRFLREVLRDMLPTQTKEAK